MDENNPKFLDYSEDEALLGAGLVAFLHMQGKHDQSSHGNDLRKISSTNSNKDEYEHIGRISVIVYRTGDLIGQDNRGIFFGADKKAIEHYVGLHDNAPIKQYEIETNNTIKAQSVHSLYEQLYGKVLDINEIDIKKKFNSTARALRWAEARIAKTLQAKGYDSVILTNPFGDDPELWVLPKNRTKIKEVPVSEFHLPGKHFQETHGNDVASPSSKAKPKSVKAKKKSGEGLVEVGKQIWSDDQPVYKVVSDGEKMFKDNIFSDDGLVLVGLRGEHKGVVLYTRPVTSHQDMLTAFDENSSDIDWAHFYTEFDEDTGKDTLFIDSYYAGYDLLEFPKLSKQPDYMDKVYDNLHIAQKALVKAGVNPKRTVTILEPVNEFKNRTPWEVKLEELSMSDKKLAELGAGVLALEGIELQEEHSTDAMICFKIPDVIRDELKEKYPFIQDADSLHITLVYLGDTRTLDVGSVIEAITNWSAYQAPIKGKLQGIARFVNGEEVDPLVMTFDSKQMPEVYEVLCDFLYGEKIEFHKEHGFIPHMTLAYIPKDEDMPVQTIEPIEINFASVWLVWNGEWVEIELSGVLNRLSWNADDFSVAEFHFPGKHDQKKHGNKEAKEDEVSKIIAANRKAKKNVSDKWEQKITIIPGYENRTVYIVKGDGEKMFVDKTGVPVNRGAVLVGIKGEHKGKVIYGRGMSHSELMNTAIDIEETSLDEWVHYYIRNERSDFTGNEILSVDLSYAGVVFDYSTDEEWELQISEAYDNYYQANKYLYKNGVSKDRLVQTYVPKGAVGGVIQKLETEMSFHFFELHLGGADGKQPHPDGSPQSVHGGDGGSVVKEKKKYDPKLLSRASAVYTAMEDTDTALGQAADNQMRGGVLRSDGRFVEFTEKTKNSNTNKIIKELEKIKESDPEAFELARQFSIADTFKVDDYEDLPDEVTVYRGSGVDEVLPKTTNVTSRRDIADSFSSSGSVKEFKIKKEDIVFSLSNSVFEEGELLVKSKNLSLKNEYLSDFAKTRKILEGFQKGQTIKMKDGRTGILQFIGVSDSLIVKFGDGKDAFIDYGVTLDEVINE